MITLEQVNFILSLQGAAPEAIVTAVNNLPTTPAVSTMVQTVYVSADWKVTALALLKEGKTHKEVADIVNKSTKSIQRLIKQTENA